MNNLTTEIEQASVFSLQNFAKIDKHVDVSTTQNQEIVFFSKIGDIFYKIIFDLVRKFLG